MQMQSDTTRIILVNGSPFLHEMIYKAIDKQEKLQVVAEVQDLNRYPEVAKQIDADWTYLLLPPEEDIPVAMEEVIKEKAPMRLLVMATDGSMVRVKGMEHHDHPMKIDELKQIFRILEKKDPFVL
jgi:hypothetical protein